MDLRDVVKELKRANKEDSLEEQAALLLNLPAKLRKICERLYARPQVVKLPHFRPVQAPSVAGVLKCLAAEMPPKGLVSHVLRSVKALAGEVVAPGNGNLLEVQIVVCQDTPQVSVKVVAGKAFTNPHRFYTPQPATWPLYEVCELQTIMLRDVSSLHLKDLVLRAPEGPLAKKLL